MERLTINLPESLKKFIDDEVASGRYADSSALIAELLEETKKQKNFERVESLIKEGIESSEAAPWTKEDWEDIRKTLHERQAREKVDQLLIVGLDSGEPRELTEDVWVEIERKVRQSQCSRKVNLSIAR